MAQSVFQRRLAYWPVWALFLVALYFFWPMDFIPDKIPLVGLVDDIGIAAAVLTGTAAKYPTS